MTTRCLIVEAQSRWKRQWGIASGKVRGADREPVVRDLAHDLALCDASDYWPMDTIPDPDRSVTGAAMVRVSL